MLFANASGSVGTHNNSWGVRRVALLAGLIFLAALVPRLPRLTYPMLWYDDFGHVRESWTWDKACGNLWVPINEHVSPLPRLTTWALVQLAGRASALPFVLALQGALAVFVSMGLLYLFLQRELGHPVYGLVGMAFFGVTSQYEEAVCWYAASFTLIALIFLLLGLLAAQRWRQGGRVRSLLLCLFWVALAPSWFGIGFLAGPLCALYLLLTADPFASKLRWRSLLLCLTPLLGTALFLAVSAPCAAEAILHTPHYHGKTALQVFHADSALVYSCRSLVDNLLLGSFGIIDLFCPLYLLPLVLAGLIGAGAWWWRLASRRSLLLLGLAFIFTSYFLIYGIRSQFAYERIAVWSRYQVFSHVGLVLFICGGLPRWQQGLVASAGAWSPTHNRVWIVSLLVLVSIQMPRSVGYTMSSFETRQREQLRLVDAVDERCRQYGISADAAQAALPPVVMAGGSEIDNAWELLRGSVAPRELAAAEVRRLLQP